MHILVRVTIHNMVVVAFEECDKNPNNKKPEEMAKSIALMYPPFMYVEYIWRLTALFSSL